MEKELDVLKASCIDKTVSYCLHKNGDAGYDMYCSKDTWIFPFKCKQVPLNFKCEIPEGRYGLLTSRSGESLHGNFVIPGIIDSTYRGQLKAIMTRVGLLPRKIKKGTRIAQLIFMPFEEYNIEIIDELSQTDRGTKGFGSSGRN